MQLPAIDALLQWVTVVLLAHLTSSNPWPLLSLLQDHVLAATIHQMTE